MDKDKTSLERRLLLAGGIIGAAVALLTGINALSEQVKKGLGVFAGLGDWELFATAVAFLLVALRLWQLSLRRRSKLRLPDALRLQRHNRQHLIGRDEEIEALVRSCRDQPLVFLDGESGVGKSALLQAGLVPELTGNAALLPVYVESLVGLGHDWVGEPRWYLAKALDKALGESGRKTEPADLVRALQSVKRRRKRIPLVILDQFDDYQTRHRQRFLNGKAWLKPARLVEQNAFWRDLCELLGREDGREDIHLLIATRSDNAGGLTSVSFRAPEAIHLEPLETRSVGQLLDRLTARQNDQLVIADPEFGWTRLRDRLEQDLERGSVVLPQQLKIVLAGLGTLPRGVLTVSAYESAGGLAGLEARFIENRINAVARRFGVGEESLRRVLLALVDPHGGQKTVERPGQDLTALFEPDAPKQAAMVLAELEKKEILRSRADAGTGKGCSWLLDHDYLARAVIEADRRANRWQRTLAEGAKALAVAGASISAPKTWVRWWRALLPTGRQLAFFRDRLFGRFRYGENRPYALKSLARLGPYLIILPLSVGLVMQYAVWLEKRSWGVLTSVATGKRNELTDDAAIIGRPASTVRHFDSRKVELFAPHVSRLHLLLTRDLQALDLRSSYGTTLNSEFLTYSDVQQLKGGDILVLAGEGAFRFSQRAYWPWQFLTGPSADVELARHTGWGLLIDGQRGRITPLAQPEEFLVLGADGNIVASEHSNEAIAVVRFRDLRAMELKGMTTKFALAATEVPYGPPDPRGQLDQVAEAQCALIVGTTASKAVSLPAHRQPRPGSTTNLAREDNVATVTEYLREIKDEWLSFEILSRDAEITASFKMTDYDYGTLRLQKGQEIFGITAMDDRNISYVTQWLLHYEGKDFQVILRNPAIEKAHYKPSVEVREQRRPLAPCLIPDPPDESSVGRLSRVLDVHQ